jgi:hypothetical protein
MGLGRKVFAANTVLAAADVNGYLMEQAVMNFANPTDRTSNVGTATAGMVTTLAGTAMAIYDGAAWQSVYPPVVTSVAGSAVDNSGTAVTTSMTATADLKNGTIWVNTANPVTITIPDVLDLWDTITIHRNAGGTVSIAAGAGVSNWAGAGTAGAGVVFKIDQTYRAAGIQKVAANSYRVVGRIVA